MVRHTTPSATVHVRATAIPHHQIKKSHKKENGYNGLHRSSPPFTTARVKRHSQAALFVLLNSSRCRSYSSVPISPAAYRRLRISSAEAFLPTAREGHQTKTK